VSQKFKPKGNIFDFNEAEILKFYDEYATKKIKSYLKSAPVPLRQEGPVKNVVADNFK